MQVGEAEGAANQKLMERIARQRGIRWTRVPFSAMTEDLQALLAGQVQAAAERSTWGPLVRNGRFRLLVTFGAELAKHFPNAPILREVGIDFTAPAPYGG